MTNVNSRVKAVIDGKAYDLKPSGNPHQKLPKPVLSYLKENGLLLEGAAASGVDQSSDLARMQATIEKLNTEAASAATALAEAQDELKKTKNELVKVESELDVANAEIVKLKPAE